MIALPTMPGSTMAPCRALHELHGRESNGTCRAASFLGSSHSQAFSNTIQLGGRGRKILGEVAGLPSLPTGHGRDLRLSGMQELNLRTKGRRSFLVGNRETRKVLSGLILHQTCFLA